MKVEYRVRPVIRYSVTRWHQSDMEGAGHQIAGVETVGLFENEAHAEAVKSAMEQSDPEMKSVNGFLIVKDTGGEVETEAYYAQSLADAQDLQMQVERETNRQWKVSRVIK